MNDYKTFTITVDEKYLESVRAALLNVFELVRSATLGAFKYTLSLPNGALAGNLGKVFAVNHETILAGESLWEATRDPAGEHDVDVEFEPDEDVGLLCRFRRISRYSNNQMRVQVKKKSFFLLCECTARMDIEKTVETENEHGFQARCIDCGRIVYINIRDE